MINGHVQNHGIVQYHDFPRILHFVRRNGWDPINSNGMPFGAKEDTALKEGSVLKYGWTNPKNQKIERWLPKPSKS